MSGVPVRAELVTDADALRAYEPGWDALAVELGLPFCAPGWLLPWWRCARPPRARLHVVVVREAERVVGVAPWFATRDRLGFRALRPLGGAVCQRVEPLAAPGRELEVTARIVELAAGRRQAPDAIFFEGVDNRSTWPRLLAGSWPGGAGAVVLRWRGAAPTLSLRGRDYDTWLATKSRNFRHDLRKKRARFLRQGGAFRLATPDTLERDLAAFTRLHHARWTPRGGSAALGPGVDAMLLAAGRALLPAGRLRLWSLDLGDEIVSSHHAQVAGTEYAYWLSGFDERHARLSPSLLGAMAVIQDAFDSGADRLDLGLGDYAYKARFADDADTLEYLRIIPSGRRYPLARVRVAPGQLRFAAEQAIKRRYRRAD
jgi:CelD/BcsL family acetyltransferase involved in cellulose biosynthesis